MANSYEILLNIGGKLASSLTSSISSASKSLQGMEKVAEKTSKSFNPIQGAIDKTSKGFGSLKNVMIGVATTVGVATSFTAIMNAASKSEETTSQLKAVLKSTGGVAGVTQEQATKLAESLSSVTTFGKGAVISSESLLLTFTKIGKDIMPDATETVLNMSQALGQDTKSSAIQLGKALNDPITGMTALQRVGVTFTAQQKSQIEAMQKVGNVAGAQKIILSELSTEFGGSARAAGATFAGQIQIIKNKMAGVGASIGIALMPTIQKVLPSITTGMVNLANLIKNTIAPGMTLAITTLTPAFNTIVSVVETVVAPAISQAFSYIKDTIIPSLAKTIKDLTPTFEEICSVVKTDVLPIIGEGFKVAVNVTKEFKDNLNLIIPVVGGLAAGMATYNAVQLIMIARTKAGLIITTLTKAWGTATTALSLLREGNSLASVAQLVLNGTMLASPAVWIAIGIGVLIAAGIALYKNWGTVSKGLREAWGGLKKGSEATFSAIGKFLKGSWNDIKNVTNTVWTGIKTFFTGLWSGITGVFSKAWNGIKTVVIAIVTPLIIGVTNIFNGMKGGLTTVFNGLKTYFTGVWNAIKLIFLGAILLVCDLFTGNFTKLKQDAVKIFTGLQNAFGQIWQGIKMIFTGALQAIVGFLKVEWSGIVNIATTLWNGLSTFFTGLWDGIKTVAIAGWNLFKSAIVALITDIVQGWIVIFNGVINFFTSLPGTLYNLGVGAFNSLKNGISSVLSTIGSVVTNGFNEAISFITSLPAKALEWGKDFINGLVNGIKGAIGAVGDAVTGVADKIRSVLHFSVPDEGPLTDYESWMPDMLKGMGQGLKVNANLVMSPVKDIALGIRNKLNGNNNPGAIDINASKSATGNGEINKGSESSIIWAPQITIQGNASKDDVSQALSISQRDFERQMEIYNKNKNRVKFA